VTVKFSHRGYCDICETDVVFQAKFDWFRDHLLCSNCGSLPRERALMNVLRRYYKKYRSMKIHETSPGDRGVSARLSRECRKYSRSFFFPDTPLGETDPTFKARCENLESLTFDDGAFDLFITQDVLEHVLDPAAAFREISRILKPGGAHVFTVPLVNKCKPSSARVRRDENGVLQHLKEPQYHGCPIDERGSLVTMDWGFDIVQLIREACGMATHMITIDDIDRGIRAEYIEVLVSVKS
jgi:predicted SAM-dependent methyltransferase